MRWILRLIIRRKLRYEYEWALANARHENWGDRWDIGYLDACAWLASELLHEEWPKSRDLRGDSQ